MASKNRVSASGAAFHKDVKQPTAKPGTGPEFDPARPRTFDLGAFISGAKSHTNTRTIPVTSRPDVAAEAERVAAEVDKLEHIAAQDREEGTPRRLSAPSETAQKITDLKARLADLTAQLDGTWVLVKLRGLEPSEQDSIRRLNPEPGVPLAAAVFAVTATVRDADAPDEEPWTDLTADEWADLIDAIGPNQYLTLDKAHAAITYQAVTPDFFERYSASRPTRGTSSN